MDEGSEPMTRFRMAEADDGWTKVVAWPAPTEKLFQSMIARFDPWLTTVRLPLGFEMLAAPATTAPPTGLARAAMGHPAPIAISANAMKVGRLTWNRRPQGLRCEMTKIAILPMSSSHRQPWIETLGSKNRHHSVGIGMRTIPGLHAVRRLKSVHSAVMVGDAPVSTHRPIGTSRGHGF